MEFLLMMEFLLVFFHEMIFLLGFFRIFLIFLQELHDEVLFISRSSQSQQPSVFNFFLRRRLNGIKQVHQGLIEIW